MRSLIIAALVAIPALSGAASADDARMSRNEFNRAARCLAYVNLAPLQSDRPDTTALDARFAAELARRPANTKNEVKADTMAIRIAGRNADTPARVQQLKAERDRTCSRVVDAAMPSPATAQN